MCRDDSWFIIFQQDHSNCMSDDTTKRHADVLNMFPKALYSEKPIGMSHY